MSTLLELIAACRTEIEKRLAVCDAATDPPWRVQSVEHGVIGNTPEDASANQTGHCQWTSYAPEQNLHFIAASRNQRPDELRGWLEQVTLAEGMLANGLVHRDVKTYIELQLGFIAKHLGLELRSAPCAS